MFGRAILQMFMHRRAVRTAQSLCNRARMHMGLGQPGAKVCSTPEGGEGAFGPSVVGHNGRVRCVARGLVCAVLIGLGSAWR